MVDSAIPRDDDHLLSTERRPRAGFYFAAIVLSSLLCGVASELLLRHLCLVCSWTERNVGEYISPYQMVNPSSWYHVRFPNDVTSYGQPEFDHELRTNSLGIRDIEHPVEKTDGELRIVGLGDSFTEGQGAAYEASYLQVLERNLNRRVEGDRVRVIVGGVAGSDPFYCFRLLKDKLLVFEPDLVTLTVNSTDVMDVVTRGGSERFLADGTVRLAEPPADEWLFSRSHLYRAFLMLLGYDWFGLGPWERVTERKRALEKLESLVEEYLELADAEGFELLVILHPDSHELSEETYSFDARRLKRHFAERRIRVLDLMDYFASRAPTVESREELYWPNDFHYTEAGYRIFAEGIEEYLLGNHLLGSSFGE